MNQIMERKTQPTFGKSECSKKLLLENIRTARRNLGQALSTRALSSLEVFTRDFGLSVKSGELHMIDGNWYVTHTGLLRVARRKRCRGIHVESANSLCDFAMRRYVFKATVYPSRDSSGFVGYGDADPSTCRP